MLHRQGNTRFNLVTMRPLLATSLLLALVILCTPVNSLATQSVFGFKPQLVDQAVTSENVVVNFVGYTATDLEEEFVTTSENVQVVIDPNLGNQFSMTVSDTTVTSEFTQTLHNGAWDLKT